jgi:hypothetical protein
MDWQAWVFMLAAWALILGMTGYCFYKLLSSDRQLGEHDE